MRFIPETEAGALRAHLDKELEGLVTLDLFIEPKSAIVVPRGQSANCARRRAICWRTWPRASDRITLTVRRPH